MEGPTASDTLAGASLRQPLWDCTACGQRSNFGSRDLCRTCGGPKAALPFSTAQGSGCPAASHVRRPKGNPAAHLALRIATYNASSWHSLQGYLQSTDAHVVLAQETKLVKSKIPEAMVWAKQRGWNSIHSAACPSMAGGSASRGVAVLARAELGLRGEDRPEVEPSRLCCACVEAPGYDCIMFGSAYLYTAQGLSDSNLNIIAKYTVFAMAAGEP